MSSRSGRGRHARPAGLARGIAGVLAALAALAAAPPAAAVERSREPVWPAAFYDYRPQLPAYAPAAGLPAIDERWNARAKLGRALFYDRGLSRNGLVSCGSCHEQKSGFDDPTRFSIGFAGRVTRRSAMALGNALFNPDGAYFRDRRAPNLEAQVLAPFADAIEMGLAEGELEARVAATAWYAPLFSEAFGDTAADKDRIADALATFVRSMTSFGARYDIARASAASPLENFSAFDAVENRGKFLFFAGRGLGGAGCAACHETEAFVMIGARDNGLPPLPGKADGGVGEVTGRAADMGLFRAPSLRNVAVSAPYMRDGRFATLDEVVDHYSRGAAATANLDPLLAGPDGKPAPLRLSAADRDALVAFLKTLTDAAFLSDRRFSDPFLR